MSIRTVTLSVIVKLAMTIARMVSSNCIMDIAVKNHYSYADYVLLCRCLDRTAQTEKAYVLHTMEYQQLELEGI